MTSIFHIVGAMVLCGALAGATIALVGVMQARNQGSCRRGRPAGPTFGAGVNGLVVSFGRRVELYRSDLLLASGMSGTPEWIYRPGPNGCFGDDAGKELPHEGRSIAFGAGALMCWYRGRIALLDAASGEVRKMRRFAEVAAATHTGAGWAVASDGAIFTLDGASLRVTSRCELSCNPLLKTPHDLFALGGSLWVLDNVVLPFYIFRLAVTKRGKMRVVFSREIEDINAHLDWQWIDLGNRCWHVVETQSFDGGCTQSLLTFDMDSGNTIHENSFFGRCGTTGNGRWSGYAIGSVTPATIPWVLIRRGTTVCLATMSIVGGVPDFTVLLELGEGQEFDADPHIVGYRVRLRRVGNRLFALIDRYLRIIDITGFPVILGKVEFNEVPRDIEAVS